MAENVHSNSDFDTINIVQSSIINCCGQACNNNLPVNLILSYFDYNFVVSQKKVSP